MKRTRQAVPLALPLVLASGAAASATPPHAPPSYTLTEIPTGNMRLNVHAINSAGAVTGQASGEGQIHAFVWSPGSGILDIRPAGTALGSFGRAINVDGQVIGDACVPPPSGNGVCGLHFFLYTPGQGTVQMNSGPGAAVFQGVGSFDALLSDNGSIAGTANRYTINERALYFSPLHGWTDLTPLIPGATRARVRGLSSGGMAILDAGPGSPVSLYVPEWGVLPLSDIPIDAAGANGSGDYTGSASFGGASSAVLGGLCIPPTDLDPQRQFPGSQGLFINDFQTVAGTWNGGHFLYTPETGMIDLGLDHPSARLTSLNLRGDVTASAHTELYEQVPLAVLRGGPVRTAQDLVDPMRTRIIVERISPINRDGQFVVSGRRPGAWQPVSLLASPGAPCPADADRNGAVNSADITAFFSIWLSDFSSPMLGILRADFDGSGSTDSGDITAFLGAWIAAAAAGGC